MTATHLTKFNGLNRFFCSIFSIVCTVTALAVPDSGERSVLFIGNSYTHMNDMPYMFDKMCKAEGLNVYVEKSAQSGASFRIHSKRLPMYEAIASRKWDYVILQGFSREFSYSEEHIAQKTIPYVDKIIASIRESSPKAQMLFYMTWGYENGFGQREEINTYEKMADSIARGYAFIGKHFKVPVVPVGMVWKEVKKDTAINLYASDRAHPSEKGSYLIANMFFESMFGVAAKPELGIITELDAQVIRSKVSNYLSSRVIQKDEEPDASENSYRMDTTISFYDPSGLFMKDKKKEIENRLAVINYFGRFRMLMVSYDLRFENAPIHEMENEGRLYAIDPRRRRKNVPMETRS